MKFKKWIATALVATLAVGLFAGCGGNNNSTGSSAAESSASSDDKVITIGASVTPHAVILNHLADQFEKEGYEVEDLLNLERYHSLNLITTGNGKKAFITKLPPEIEN